MHFRKMGRFSPHDMTYTLVPCYAAYVVTFIFWLYVTRTSNWLDVLHSQALNLNTRMCLGVCCNIENVKEQHQGEAERQSIQR